VTSERKIRANRANSRASTGPKTTRGRTHSAKNALRHALSVPIHSDSTLSADVEELTRAIAGPGASAEIQNLARRAAEAQIDVRRVREARRQLFSDATYDSEANTRQKITLLRNVLRGKAPDTLTLTELANLLALRPQGPEKLASILSDKAGRLLILDRYERRAVSRRKRAIRALDSARQYGGKMGVGATRARYGAVVVL
jgi:hypothetical protein